MFYDTTNEFAGLTPETLGIDFISLAGALMLVFTYPISGILVDRYGLGVMSFASVMLAMSAGWWWLLSGNNFLLTLSTRIVSSFAGSLNACCLLRVSNNWFAVHERALAVAVVAIVANLGTGAGILYGTFFIDDSTLRVNDDLRSCESDFLNSLTFDEQNDLGNKTLECSDEALEAFCCAADIDMDSLNLLIAIILSVVAVYTCFVVIDAPEKPPSVAGSVKKCSTVWESVKTMFKHRNYNQICLADFLCTGPVFVVFATIDRIFPPRVQEFSTLAGAAGIAAAIPSAIIFSRLLAKKKNFFEMTAGGYASGAICFLIITGFIFADTEFTDYGILVLAVVALVANVLWTVSVYELKIEYVFEGFAIQGAVVAVDRTIINFAAFVFLLAIPPERYKGDLIEGRQFTFIIGAVFVTLGAALAVCIPKSTRRDYRRQAFESDSQGTSLVDDFEEPKYIEDSNTKTEEEIKTKSREKKNDEDDL